MNYERFVLPALRVCADRIEVVLMEYLWSQLRLLYESSISQPEDITATVRLKLKSACFNYTQTLSHLCLNGYFSMRPINMYFLWFSVFLPLLFSKENAPITVSTEAEEQVWRPIRHICLTMSDHKKGRRMLFAIDKHLAGLRTYVDAFGTGDDHYVQTGASHQRMGVRRARFAGSAHLATLLLPRSSRSTFRAFP